MHLATVFMTGRVAKKARCIDGGRGRKSAENKEAHTIQTVFKALSIFKNWIEYDPLFAAST